MRRIVPSLALDMLRVATNSGAILIRTDKAGIRSVAFRRRLLLAAVAPEQSLELGEDRGEEVFAAEIGDDALLDLSAFAVGFDDADVLVECAAGRADFDSFEVHVVKYHDTKWKNQGESAGNFQKNRDKLSLHFSARQWTPMWKVAKKIGIPARVGRRGGGRDPKHGLANEVGWPSRRAETVGGGSLLSRRRRARSRYRCSRPSARFQIVFPDRHGFWGASTSMLT